ncbi:hypothetical protein CLAFUW4_09238 [Fulvia fulva]|uniref:Uncharacterized protein n=1 Tax=Passalora fulva TaxID=5499 RepID=A0A9Q8UTI3_PASFU|nr:uncharacterized protein CLAFUR5_09339 [Fulvia fulva]KAK4613329.1 hypothetical protein CLAFUR4_09244 [Fulvia fulva]KAK4614909.1 hypothetical protein CLAFUR0_09236 [Fulvia fulva]UJO21835.1 hypothetical protein CLAFUR5_09339 [Fulvia fulva]WPV20219.1 hypothetical protein CLAFUW4_09238 [Fulvia fulva]WPV35197.1 hypothetical protein CLAFUW7_09239 [Fulvia fulva]
MCLQDGRILDLFHEHKEFQGQWVGGTAVNVGRKRVGEVTARNDRGKKQRHIQAEGVDEGDDMHHEASDMIDKKEYATIKTEAGGFCKENMEKQTKRSRTDEDQPQHSFPGNFMPAEAPPSYAASTSKAPRNSDNDMDRKSFPDEAKRSSSDPTPLGSRSLSVTASQDRSPKAAIETWRDFSERYKELLQARRMEAWLWPASPIGKGAQALHEWERIVAAEIARMEHVLIIGKKGCLRGIAGDRALQEWTREMNEIDHLTAHVAAETKKRREAATDSLHDQVDAILRTRRSSCTDALALQSPEP